MIPRVLVETAKLDRFAYTHTHVQTHARSLNPGLFWRGNALFVPGHLVKTLTADLLLSPAMAINHSAPLPNTYIQSHTGRYHQPIPVHHARYHLFMFYGRIVDPFFIRVQSLLLSLQALCLVLSARGLMVDVGPFTHLQLMYRPLPTFTLNAISLSFYKRLFR